MNDKRILARLKKTLGEMGLSEEAIQIANINKFARKSDIEYIKISGALFSLVLRDGASIKNTVDEIIDVNGVKKKLILYQEIVFNGLRTGNLFDKFLIERDQIPNVLRIKVYRPLPIDRERLESRFGKSYRTILERFPLCFNWTQFPAMASPISEDEAEIIFYPSLTEFEEMESGNLRETFWLKEVFLKNKDFIRLLSHEISHIINEIRGSKDFAELSSVEENINSKEEIQARMIEILFEIRRNIFIFKDSVLINLLKDDNPKGFIDYLFSRYNRLLEPALASEETKRTYIKRFFDFFFELKEEAVKKNIIYTDKGNIGIVSSRLKSNIEKMAQSANLTLGELIDVGQNVKNPDFYFQRQGSPSSIGTVAKTLEEKTDSWWGIKVKEEAGGVILPDYLYYALMNIHSTGFWKSMARGETDLQSIRLEDLKSIPVG